MYADVLCVPLYGAKVGNGVVGLVVEVVVGETAEEVGSRVGGGGTYKVGALVGCLGTGMGVGLAVV